MSTRRSTLFYGLLIVLASVLVGMVIASRLDLTPISAAQTFSAPPANSAPLNGPVDATTFRNIAKSTSPAVVNIRTESRQKVQNLRDLFGGGGGDNPLDGLFGRGGRGGRGGQGQGSPGDPDDTEEPQDQIAQAAGTGFIISKSGLILTNNHVVEGAQSIKVSLYGEDDEQQYDAKIIGRDELSDTALIQLTEKVNHELPEIKFGDSSQLQAGDWVMAIGNPFGLSHTVSVGVISGIGRDQPRADKRSPKYLQTDAAINPGNSGGPLLNLRGEVIGINTMIFSNAGEGNIGIGFAVPINDVRNLLPQLMTGKVTRGRIGVSLADVDRDVVDELQLKTRDGAIVASVTPDSAASKAGLKAGDVLLAFNGKAIKRSEDLMQMVVATKPGSTVQARLMRSGQEKTVNLTVDELDLDVENPQRQAGKTDGAPAAPDANKGFGLQLGPITPQLDRELELNGVKGALIYKVDTGSPAARVLRRGDVIIRVGAKTVTSSGEAADELAKVPARGSALVWIMRGGQEFFVTMTRN